VKYDWLLSKAENKYCAAIREIRRVVRALPQNVGLNDDEKCCTYPIYPNGQFENFESEDVSNFKELFEGMVDMRTCRVSFAIKHNSKSAHTQAHTNST